MHVSKTLDLVRSDRLNYEHYEALSHRTIKQIPCRHYPKRHHWTHCHDLLEARHRNVKEEGRKLYAKWPWKASILTLRAIGYWLVCA